MRRDNKGRILRPNEYQRSDGRYAYLYIKNGKKCFLYSWTLVETDKTPSGKKKDKALRTKIEEYLAEKDNPAVSAGADMTVQELIDLFISFKTPLVRDSTLREYGSEKRRIAKTSIYEKRIGDLNVLQCKQWIYELSEMGISHETIRKTQSLLRLSMEMAYENDWIIKNPCAFKLSNILGKPQYHLRYPLNDEWKKKYLDFVKNHSVFSYYYDSIFVLVNTGLRISELCGLTKADVDFDRGFIDITRQLLPAEKNGRYLQTTKTTNGIRKVPITKKVRQILKKKIRNISCRRDNPVVEGVTDFLFLSKSDTLMDSRCWNKIFTRIYRDFVEEYPDYEKQDEYSKITAHILRHTFCTDLVKAHVDEKTIISIVGHASYATTMKIYTHYDFTKISEDFLAKMG